MIDSDSGEISLPLGVHGDRYTKYDVPLLTVSLSDPEVRSATDGGWPTVVVGEESRSVLGVAAGYPAQWHDSTPEWEIDVLVDSDYEWWVLVEFEDLATAEASGRYGWGDRDGVKRRPWDRKPLAFESVRETVDGTVTPIYHDETDHDLPAFAIQRADSYSTLKRMFDLRRYGPLAERREQLEVATVPRETRWEDEDTSLRDLAEDVVDDETDESS